MTLYPKTRLRLAFGADPAADPAADPDGWDWTEVDYEDQDFTVKRGRADESSEASPASFSAVLPNRDGRYTPEDRRALHWPNVRRGTPVEFAARFTDDDPWDVRFVGQVSEWAPSWPYGDLSDPDDPEGSPGEANVTIVCNGILRRLGQGARPFESPLHRYLASNSVAYWPLEDGAVTDHPASPIEGVAPLGHTGKITWASNDTLPGSKSLPTVKGDFALIARLPAPNPPDWVASAMMFFPSAPSGHTVLMRVNTQDTMWRLVFDGSTTLSLEIWDLGVGPWVPEIDDVAFNFGDLLDRWVRVSIETISATTRARIAADGGDIIVLEASFGSGTDGLRAVVIPFDAPDGFSIGHIAATEAHPPALPENGWVGETAAARIERICDEEGLDLIIEGEAGDSTPMGVQQPVAMLEQLAQCAAAESGILAEQRDRPGLRFVTRAARYNQLVDLALDASADEIAEPFHPAYDDQGLRNDVTVTRDGGSSAQATDEDSIGEDGRYDETVTLSLATDLHARHHAAWRLHLATWGGMRYPAISGSLDTAPVGWLDLLEGDRVQIEGLPPQHPADAVDVIVEGTTETVTPVDWKIEANCSPAGPWDVGTLEGPFAHVAEDPVTVMFVGDSITEGAVVTLDQRYQNLVIDRLRDRFDTPAGGFGLHATQYVYELAGWTVSGTVTFNNLGIIWPWGPGLRGALLSATGEMTRTVEGTTARVWYRAYSTDGHLSVTVDGGAPVDIDCAGTASVHDAYVDVPLGVSGSHTIEVAHASGNPAGFGGVQVFDGDETEGVRGLDASRGGATAALYAAAGTGAFDGVTDLADWSVAADVAVVLIGVNDWAGSVAAATFKTNLETIVSGLRDGNPDLAVLVVALYEADVAHIDPWSDYVAAMSEVADTSPRCGFLDLSSVMPAAGTTAGDASGFYHDGLHPTAAGHAEIAARVAAHQLFGGVDSRLDSAGSTLASGIDDNDTTLSVAVDGILWTTDTEHVPFGIVIDGEPMTVTAISGASSPQTFTVTRDTLAPAAHLAGAEVHLTEAFVLAL